MILPACRPRSCVLIAVIAQLIVISPGWAQDVRQTSRGDRSSRTGGHLQLFHQRVATAQSEVLQLAEQTAELEREIAELLQQLATLQRPKKERQDAEPEAGVKELRYRPPLFRFEPEKNSVSFICQGGRLMFVDTEIILQQVLQSGDAPWNKLKNSARDNSRLDEIVSVPRGHFDIRYSIDGEEEYREIVRKPGNGGETHLELVASDSEYRRALANFDPAAMNVELTVFHDSFETFRQARLIAWESSFGVNWQPKAPAEPLRIRFGSGGSGRN